MITGAFLTFWWWTLFLYGWELSPFSLHNQGQDAEDSEEVGPGPSRDPSAAGFIVGTLPRVVSCVILKLRRALLILTSTSTSFSTALITYFWKKKWNRDFILLVLITRYTTICPLEAQMLTDIKEVHIVPIISILHFTGHNSKSHDLTKDQYVRFAGVNLDFRIIALVG